MCAQVFVETEGFLAALGRCLQELQATATSAPSCLSDPNLHDERNPDSIWRPKHWLDVLAPLAVFLRQSIMRFVLSTTKPELQVIILSP